METKQKNLCLKERKVEEPYEIWRTPDGSWEWRVLKKWQLDDNKPYARWFCAVKSPFTYGSFEIGDVYVKDIKEHAVKVEEIWSENPETKFNCIKCGATWKLKDSIVCPKCEEADGGIE